MVDAPESPRPEQQSVYRTRKISGGCSLGADSNNRVRFLSH